MKLINKFGDTIMRHDLGRNEVEETKQQCVEVAKDFAIGFGEWLSDNNIHEGSIKQLLEIYESKNKL